MSIIDILTNIFMDIGIMGRFGKNIDRLAHSTKSTKHDPNRRQQKSAVQADIREKAADDLVISLARIAKRHERHQDSNLT